MRARRAFPAALLLAGLLALGVGPAQAASSARSSSGVALQPDGKIVTVALDPARFKADGSVDTSFGIGGVTVPSSVLGNGVALQPKGRIIVVGGFSPRLYHSYLALVRYKPTGARNRSFGRKGKVVTPFLGKAWQEGTGVVVQPDGKIVAAGSTGAGFALARYNPSGSLDPSFGSGGKVVTPLGSDAGANGVALQDDGKIVLAGRLANEYLGKSDFVLARYKADGSPDPSFGLGGVVTTPIGSGSSSARAVLIQPDGKIVAAGVVVLSTAGADELRFALARYNPNGSLDTSFGAGGEVTTAFFLCECDEAYGVEATAVALQPDGKIVAAGGTLNSFMARDEFALARYNPSGSLDASFGTGGKVTTSFGFPPPEMGSTGDFAEALAMQPDGKIVATGESNFGPHGEQFDDALARYKPDGSLDKSFAKDGTSSPAFKICIVPKLRGTTLPKARRMIRKRRCRAGKVTTAFSGKVKAGRVISQKPRAHSWHRKGTKVSLVVSAGRR